MQAVIDQKYIRAPFDGSIGIRQVNLGQYLNADDGIGGMRKCQMRDTEASLTPGQSRCRDSFAGSAKDFLLPVGRRSPEGE
ncbi:hypothetical protein GCM10023157_37020 [Gluconacetobacter asukensis]